jgi:tetratricopeptide (TPR) repeat protein
MPALVIITLVASLLMPSLAAAQEPEAPRVRRQTICPWSVDVLGKSYEGFTNDDASKVLTDWLTNALVSFKVFNVVNRSKIKAALDEQKLAAAGYAQSVSEEALTSAGKLLKVDLMVLGNVKNLGLTSEVDFKLLDVNTGTYRSTLNYTIPFTASIELLKPEVSRVVAGLAQAFPISADVVEIRGEDAIVVGVGSQDGVIEGLEVEVSKRGSPAVWGKGYVRSVDFASAEVEVEKPAKDLNVFDYVAAIHVASPAQAALNRGNHYYKQGRYQDALTSYGKGIEADAADGMLQAAYARGVWKTHDYQKAAFAFRQALQLRPDDLDLVRDAAEAFLDAGKLQELLEAAARNERVQRNARLLEIQGRALELRGDYAEARAAYQKALGADPTSPSPHMRLGLLALREKRVEDARTEWTAARGKQGSAKAFGFPLAPDVAMAALFRAGTPARDAAAALASFADESEKKGDYEGLFTAADVLLSVGDAKAATDVASRGITANPGYFPGILVAARAEAAAGNTQKAIELIDRSSVVMPENVELLILQGRLLTEAGRNPQAEEKLRRAKSLAEADWRPCDALGDLLAATSQSEKAIQEYTRAVERAEAAKSSALATRLFKLGRQYVIAERYPDAAPYLERSLGLSPDNPECRYYLGVCYFSANTAETDAKARDAFMVTRELLDSRYYLGTLNDRREDPQQALPFFRECVEKSDRRAKDCQEAFDRIDSMTGQVLEVMAMGKQVKINLGRNYPVSNGAEAIVLGAPPCRIRVVSVQDKTSIADVTDGQATVGRTVRFRPARPRGLKVEAAQGGVRLSWQPGAEAELDGYTVYRSQSEKGPWSERLKKLKRNEAFYLDKSGKRGVRFFYIVRAVNERDAESSASDIVSATLP